MNFKPTDFRFWLIAASLAFAGIPYSTAHAAFGFKLDGSLDKEAISHAYFEGDFSRILPPLEMYRQVFPASATREDSVFVFKYLSVIYAADSTTRPKAESYMVQLLKLMPTVELIDLYISDNIQAIFKDVREKYLKQRQYLQENDFSEREKQDAIAQPKLSDRTSKKWIWWMAGGVGAAAIATTTYYVLNDKKSPGSSSTIKP